MPAHFLQLLLLNFREKKDLRNRFVYDAFMRSINLFEIHKNECFNATKYGLLMHTRAQIFFFFEFALCFYGISYFFLKFY